MVHIECFGYVAKVSECSLPITVYVNGKMYMWTISVSLWLLLVNDDLGDP